MLNMYGSYWSLTAQIHPDALNNNNTAWKKAIFSKWTDWTHTFAFIINPHELNADIGELKTVCNTLNFILWLNLHTWMWQSWLHGCLLYLSTEILVYCLWHKSQSGLPKNQRKFIQFLSIEMMWLFHSVFFFM